MIQLLLVMNFRYNTVSYLLGTKCIYEITNILTTKTQGLVGITPENIVERMETLKEYVIMADVATEDGKTIECYWCNDPSLVIDDTFDS